MIQIFFPKKNCNLLENSTIIDTTVILIEHVLQCLIMLININYLIHQHYFIKEINNVMMHLKIHVNATDLLFVIENHNLPTCVSDILN